MSGRCRWLYAFLALTATSLALADSPAPPMSYKEIAPGGKYVFVMIAPRAVEEEVRSLNEETAAGIRETRRVYTRSGMYRNDGSREPLWTVDWYAHGVHLAPDGVHLIRPGPSADLRADKTPNLDCEAVSFFANGQLVRTYRISDLVDEPDHLQRTVSHFQWRQEERVSGEFEYTITTLDGNRFVFDVRSGEVISASRPDRRPQSGGLSRSGGVVRWGWWAALGMAAVAVAGWLSYRCWSRRRVR